MPNIAETTTALIKAASQGELDQLKEMLKQGADLNAKAEDDVTTALSSALNNGQIDVARFLVNNGAAPVTEYPSDFAPSPMAMKFFMDQVAYRARGDWDGIMRDFYNDDAVMITYDFVLRSKEDIKKHFIDGNAASGKLMGFSISNYQESENIIIMRSTLISEFVLTKANDTYVFRDGKVSIYSAHTIEPQKTEEWAKKWMFDEYKNATIFNPIKI